MVARERRKVRTEPCLVAPLRGLRVRERDSCGFQGMDGGAAGGGGGGRGSIRGGEEMEARGRGKHRVNF